MNNATDVRSLIVTYLDILWRRRRLILMTLLCTPILGLILYLFSPKRYEASTSLATFNTIPSFLKDVNSVPDLETQFSGIKAYVTSPAVLKKIALQTGLLAPDSSEEKIQGLVKGLSKEITVTSSGKNLAEIKLLSDDPKTMVPILNALSASFMEEYMKPITAQAKSLTLVLDKESQAQVQKLNEAIQKVNDFKNTKDQILPEQENIYTTQLKTLVDTIATNEANYKMALEERKWLKDSFAHSNSDIANLDRDISENNTNLINMKKIYAPDYPGIRQAEELAKQLKQEREKLYKQLASTNKALPKKEADTSDQPINADQYASLTEVQLKKYQELEQRINALKVNLKDLYGQKETLISALKKSDGTQDQLALLTKAVDDNQKAYDDLRKQYTLANMSTQLDYNDQLSPIKVVATPQEPLTATGRRTLNFFLLLAFIAGLGLSVGLSIVLDLMDNRVRKKSTLQNLFDLPVLTRIGNLKPQ